jgi:hypothetical protein
MKRCFASRRSTIPTTMTDVGSNIRTKPFLLRRRSFHYQTDSILSFVNATKAYPMAPELSCIYIIFTFCSVYSLQYFFCILVYICSYISSQ